MSLTMLRVARGLALAAFMAAGIWLAFWHHRDALQPVFILALGIPLALNAWLAFVIRSREAGER